MAQVVHCRRATLWRGPMMQTLVEGLLAPAGLELLAFQPAIDSCGVRTRARNVGVFLTTEGGKNQCQTQTMPVVHGYHQIVNRWNPERRPSCRPDYVHLMNDADHATSRRREQHAFVPVPCRGIVAVQPFQISRCCLISAGAPCQPLRIPHKPQGRRARNVGRPPRHAGSPSTRVFLTRALNWTRSSNVSFTGTL